MTDLTPEQRAPLILVQRAAAAWIREDGEQLLLIDNEIGANPAFWRTIALAAVAEYAEQVRERLGDDAHAWLLRRIDHDLR
ncbi:hypothetical protein [Mycobacterium interjectum]|uniref:hypothetical protein n=1 Tax=Mycobacterium interjectum TaxID=33895 RepID=UPI00082C48D5|nr:hypothetical protein [Mycobacterium interjectum]MCV7089614.1 hypothetical protein [Mycobacterium interjectum]